VSQVSRSAPGSNLDQESIEAKANVPRYRRRLELGLCRRPKTGFAADSGFSPPAGHHCVFLDIQTVSLTTVRCIRRGMESG
jgi:hypothetical protein